MRSVLSMVIASVLVVSACSSESSSTDPTGPITPSATATTFAAVGCDTGATEPRPASAESITRSEMDLDGDGRIDVVEVYASGGEWRARMTLHGGYSADVLLGNGAVAYALGGLDLDGSGNEFFSVIGSGASTTVIGIYTFADYELASMLDADGVPVAPVGASAVNQSSLRCLPGIGIDVFSQTTSDGIVYQQTVERFGLDDGTLVSRGSETETLTIPDDRKRILDASRFDCDGPAL